MFSTFKGAARIALAVSIFSVLGLTASAQTITYNGLAPPATIGIPHPTPATPLGTQSFYYTGTGTVTWVLTGDLAVESPSTLTSNPINVKSLGYGKGRVTASVSTQVPVMCNGVQLQCSGVPQFYTQTSSSFLDVYKKFTTWPIPNTIVGPTCLPSVPLVAPFPQVTYSINSIVTKQNQIQAGIGTDNYYWQVTPTVAFTYEAGDQSSITFAPAANTNYTVKVIVGRANSAVPPTNPIVADFNFATNPAVKTLTATTGSATLNPSVFPCVKTNASSFQFTLLTNSLLTYDIQVPSTWTKTITGVSTYPFQGDGLTKTIVIGVDNHGGNVIITATGGCSGTQTVVRAVNRQLVAATTPTLPAPTGFQILSKPTGCITPTDAANGVAFRMVLNGAPANTRFKWTLPTGWFIQSTLTPGAGISLFSTTPNVWLSGSDVMIKPLTPHTGGTITVNAENCASSIGLIPDEVVKLTVNVTGQLNCGPVNTYTIQRGIQSIGPPMVYFRRVFSITSGVGGCIPDNLSNAFIYTWRQLDPTTGAVIAGTTITTNAPQVTFPVDIMPILGARVEVTINDPASCLNIVIDQANRRPAPSPGGPAPQPSSSTSSARQASGATLTAYPNPAGSILHVGLPAGTKAVLTLRDLTGRVVREVAAAGASAVLPVADLPTGTYSLRAVLNTGEVVNRTVQVQH